MIQRTLPPAILESLAELIRRADFLRDLIDDIENSPLLRLQVLDYTGQVLDRLHEVAVKLGGGLIPGSGKPYVVDVFIREHDDPPTVEGAVTPGDTVGGGVAVNPPGGATNTPKGVAW